MHCGKMPRALQYAKTSGVDLMLKRILTLMVLGGVLTSLSMAAVFADTPHHTYRRHRRHRVHHVVHHKAKVIIKL
jgi:hypothetical protein